MSLLSSPNSVEPLIVAIEIFVTEEDTIYVFASTTLASTLPNEPVEVDEPLMFPLTSIEPVNPALPETCNEPVNMGSNCFNPM